MYQVIIVVHVLLGLGVVGLVLMQQGKGADAGAAFGTGSSGSVFGAQGAASFLSRATAILATLFFMTSLGLAVLNGKQGAAYDLMNAPKVEQDTLGIPDVSGAKGSGSASPVTDLKSEEVPVAAPAVSGAEQAVEKK
ncbi:MAG: preprotein translocase subunit SecG [Methylobacter tundripaludum]|jgi:preprotein translocase subunit SecG|uniref:Protein-export membrane protein SecG n=2 Tax=Methylobacter TaxID=429 RepID=A0A2S6HD60_9GAMM|nr:preprotein translocase subunit SecG [Methylobacter tundripaludum]MDI1276419.1 preprotein translocase subunit SecG [Methylobacter sp.]MDI1357151.1 preprotein translocase subunit SecG [Methylobacter sp.]PPK75434.1 protein translocase subunit secG [Methylobacter tundripaludum]